MEQHANFQIDGISLEIVGHGLQNPFYPSNLYTCVTPTSHLLLRSGRIDTELKWKNLKSLLDSEQSAHLPWRLSISQIENPEEYWDKINEENRIIIFANERQVPFSTIVHLCIPFPNFYHLPPNPKIIASVRQRLNNLPKMINMEALAQYCGWFHYDFKNHYNEIMKHSANEFRLEARLADLELEVESLFLKDKINDILLIFELQEYLNDHSDEKMLQIEKELTSLRQGIKSTLQVRYNILNAISLEIDKIMNVNQNLIPISEQVLLLKTLLGSESDIPGYESIGWVETFMLLHLFNRRLGVTTAINGEQGGHKTNFAFAIALALSIIDGKASSGELLNLIKDWKQRTLNYNRHLAKDDVTAEYVKQEPLLAKFRFLVYKILKQFHITKGKHVETTHMIQDPEYLNLLPSHVHLPNGKNIRIVDYDSETGIPVALTKWAEEKLTEVTQIIP